MSRVIYMDCTSGVSGDMIAGALIQLGMDTDRLKNALASLPITGYEIQITQIEKAGVTACDFLVQLDAKHENHDHDMEYLYGHKKTGRQEALADLKQPVQNCEHHAHRNLSDIENIIRAGDFSVSAKEKAMMIFRLLAEAEARVHGTSIEKVHFHEVGAVDSIIDIVTIALCLDWLKTDTLYFDSLYDGTGTVRCRHGIIPVPAPAVAELVKMQEMPIRILDVEGEYVTPTGAAVLAAFGQVKENIPQGKKIATGIGAGKRKTPLQGILKVTLMEE